MLPMSLLGISVLAHGVQRILDLLDHVLDGLAADGPFHGRDRMPDSSFCRSNGSRRPSLLITSRLAATCS